MKEQIEKEYQDILTNGGIPTPDTVPDGFGGFQSSPPPLGNGDLLPVLGSNGHSNPEYDRWLHTKWLFLAGLILGIAAGFIELIRMVGSSKSDQ